METEPITTRSTYRDTVTGLVVSVKDIWIDEDGEPQIRAYQYTGYPIAAYKALRDDSEHDRKLSLHADDIRERLDSGELEPIEP